MSVTYAETYIIGGQTYGIEDYTQPGDHFFPGNDHKRFRLWRSGCGIGQTDDLDEARRLLHGYALSEARAAYHGHQERMISAEKTMAKLGDDPFNLGKFSP